MNFFHQEGRIIISVSILLFLIFNAAIYFMLPNWLLISVPFTAIFLLLILQFFRNPKRQINIKDNNIVYAPADGKIVVMEETEETEYFGDKRKMISIFMSPTNVHVNRFPISGIINYYHYHAGKYLVAWHPKSSTENERTTTVIKTENGEVLLRQIAGALAKRIVNYAKVGDIVIQGTEMGFIKFGSRVDIYLPLQAQVQVSLRQKVKGNVTIIAKL
ncbi:MAG: phosphatidylserine decarboxylase family protein [Saprospiraceae bacterium]|nr:phosphatidylserine decarboxylase family protein [Saprospiraceae bacterium]